MSGENSRMVGTLSILEWFREQQKQSDLESRVIRIQDACTWEIDDDGTLCHPDKSYYEGVIVKYRRGDGEYFENLMLRSTSSHRTQGRQVHGVILLAEYDQRFLVQAKAEAGNVTPGHVVLTTTVQSSHENLTKYPIPYKELIDEPAEFVVAAPQDAGMFRGKHNEYRYVKLREEPEILSERFRLATVAEIAELQKRNYVGDHLTQMLGHLYLHNHRTRKR
jgi:hypothetical protein